MIAVSTLRSLVLCAVTLAGAPALAQSDDMNQPETPKGEGDMLKPSQIKTTGESANPSNDSGFFLGGGIGVGQGKSTEGGSAGMAMLLGVEPGYQMNTGSWSRVEISGEALFGKIGFREPEGSNDLTIGMGILAKVGLGYSLGNKMMGVTRVGVGPVLAKFEGKSDGVKFKSDTLSGLAGQIGYDIVFPMNSLLDAVGGINLTHFQFDVDKVKVDGDSYDIDRSVNVNLWAAHAGLRLRF